MVYKKDFDRIQSRYAQLFYNITEMVEEAQVSLEKLKKFLTFYDDLEAPLKDADTVTKVMRVVQHCSSFINCSCLKDVAIHLKIAGAREEIEAYEKFVEEFCQHKLIQHSYVTSFLADQSRHPLSSETITLKLEWNPEEKTLANIQDTLRKTFKSLTDHIQVLSFFEKQAMG